MIGYPFFYENGYIEQKDSEQDEKFMIFSLDLISENSDSKLKKLSTVPLVLKSSKLPFGDEATWSSNRGCIHGRRPCATVDGLFAVDRRTLLGWHRYGIKVHLLPLCE